MVPLVMSESWTTKLTHSSVSKNVSWRSHFQRVKTAVWHAVTRWKWDRHETFFGRLPRLPGFNLFVIMGPELKYFNIWCKRCSHCIFREKRLPPSSAVHGWRSLRTWDPIACQCTTISVILTGRETDIVFKYSCTDCLVSTIFLSKN